MQYAVNDSVEILFAGPLWVVAGFGRRLRQPASVRRHERLQAWSLDVLARRAERLLGLRVAVDASTLDVLTPGPVIVLCRHVNLVDASLPSLMYRRLGMRSRGVIMAELLADPGFDLIYGRTGSVFVARDNGAEARLLIQSLADGVDATTAVIIFPEGRLFRDEIRHRLLLRLAETSPERSARLSRGPTRVASTPWGCTCPARRAANCRRRGRRPHRSRRVRVVQRTRPLRAPGRADPMHRMANPVDRHPGRA